jgi:hypothetical protein
MEHRPNLQTHMPESNKQNWTRLPHGHLPHPTYFPAGLAMGVTFFFWGLITSWVVMLVGAGLFTAALAGWITEIRNERKRNPTT